MTSRIKIGQRLVGQDCEPLVIAEIVYARVTVEHLEEVLLDHGGDILGGQGPAVIRVVDVGENRAADPVGLFFDCAQIVADRFLDVRPVLRWDHFGKISRIDVNRNPIKRVRDFLALNQDETPSLFHERAKLVERLETDLESALISAAARFDPLRPKA